MPTYIYCMLFVIEKETSFYIESKTFLIYKSDFKFWVFIVVLCVLLCLMVSRQHSKGAADWFGSLDPDSVLLTQLFFKQDALEATTVEAKLFLAVRTLNIENFKHFIFYKVLMLQNTFWNVMVLSMGFIWISTYSLNYLSWIVLMTFKLFSVSNSFNYTLNLK